MTEELDIIRPTYRIFDCLQGSEEWDRLRHRPTASNFDRVVTTARGDYSKSATDYACEIVAKRLGVYTEPPPSFWMEWGMENEEFARATYEELNEVAVQQAGFIMPLSTDDFGGSPDGIICDSGLLEIKCPKPETLIRYHSEGTLPDAYKQQVQGLLYISQLAWCDFFAWHPELNPFQVRVYPDLAYHAKIESGLHLLLEEIARVELCVKKEHHGSAIELEIIIGDA